MVQEGIDIKSIQWTQHWQLNNAHTHNMSFCTINHLFRCVSYVTSTQFMYVDVDVTVVPVVQFVLQSYLLIVTDLWFTCWFHLWSTPKWNLFLRSSNWWTPGELYTRSTVCAHYIVVLVQWASRVRLYLNMYEDIIFVAKASHMTAYLPWDSSFHLPLQSPQAQLVASW